MNDMKTKTSWLWRTAIILLGLILFFGGIAAGIPGAWIVGLIAMAVNLHGLKDEGRQV
jgi:hypothetical protein